MEKTFVLTTGNVDSSGDKLMPNAIKLTGKSIPVLREFDNSNPIGVVKEIKTEDDKTICTAVFKEDPTGLYPAIGFQHIKSHMDGNVRVFDEIKLHYVGMCVSENVDKNIKPIQ